MNTEILQITSNDDENLNILKKGASLLKAGKLVAFPTETVYGLGVSAFSENVIEVFKAKGRPSDNPLICHLSKIEDAKMCGKVSPLAIKLFEAFAPGPITVVIEKSDSISKSVTGGLDTVGVRIPGNSVARNLIELCGFPIAAPSANTSGRPSPTRAKDVFEDLQGKIPLIIDGGNCEIGIESTVVDARGEKAVILREGKITKQDMEKVGIEVVEAFDKEVRSPGVKYKHYAPKVPVILHLGESLEKIKNFAKSRTSTIALLCEDEFAKNQFPKNVHQFSLGKNEGDFMRNLYSFLRDIENHCDEIILQVPFKNSEGLLNRCTKASGGKTL